MPEANDTPDVNVNVGKSDAGSMSKMQWVGVVGVGTVLIMGVVPWMMHMISSNNALLTTTITSNTAAISEMTAQSDDVEQAIEANTRMLGRLRDKIETAPSQPTYVLTVRGLGYKFRDEDQA